MIVVTLQIMIYVLTGLCIQRIQAMFRHWMGCYISLWIQQENNYKTDVLMDVKSGIHQQKLSMPHIYLMHFLYN